MSRSRVALAVGVLSFVISGCWGWSHPGPPRHDGPTGGRLLRAAEIEAISLDVAYQHGYRRARIYDLKWKQNQSRWQVTAGGDLDGVWARLDIWIDGLSGDVLRLKDHHRHQKRVPEPVVRRKGGPPPHAPAHGHRHKRGEPDIELVFESELGVYVVVDWEGTYFYDDLFYRLIEGAWHASVRLEGDWEPVRAPKVPRGLAKKQKKNR